MSTGTVESEILSLLDHKFDPLTIDEEELLKAIEHVKNKNGGDSKKLPEVVEWFLDTQREVSFPDIIYLLEGISKMSPETISALYSNVKIDYVNITIFDLINLMNNNGQRSHIFEPLSNFYDFEEIISPQIDCDRLSRPNIIFFNMWGSVNRTKRMAYTYLFNIERKNGDFRAWLDTQKPTIRIKEAFKNLGLNYKLWDNPNTAFGLTENDELNEVLMDEDSLREKIKKLTIELTRGKYRGYLTTSPRVLWNQIKQYHPNLNDKEKLRECGSKLLDLIEQKLKPSALKKGTPIAKKFYEIRSFLETNNIPSMSDYEFFFKTWERQPSKDFCEGNDSGACVGMGYMNDLAMIHYLVDKAISLVDIYRKGRRCGQNYLVSTIEGDIPVLVLDSMEASNNDQIDSLKISLYKANHKLLLQLAKNMGFKKLMNNSNVHNTHARGYVSFVNGIHSGQDIHLTKIEDVKPIEDIFRDQRSSMSGLGFKHYLEAFGGWNSVLTDRDLYGVVENV